MLRKWKNRNNNNYQGRNNNNQGKAGAALQNFSFGESPDSRNLMIRAQDDGTSSINPQKN